MMKVNFVNLYSSMPDINYYLNPFNKLQKEMNKIKNISMERILLETKNPLLKLKYKVKLFLNNTINKIKTYRNKKSKSLVKLNNISKSLLNKRNKNNGKTNLNVKKINKLNKTTNFKYFKSFDTKKNPFEMINLRAKNLIKSSRQEFLFESQNKTQLSNIRKYYQENTPISNLLIKNAIDKKIEKPMNSFQNIYSNQKN